LTINQSNNSKNFKKAWKPIL